MKIRRLGLGLGLFVCLLQACSPQAPRNIERGLVELHLPGPDGGILTFDTLEALTERLDQIEAGPAEIRLGPGTYDLDAPLLLPSWTTLRGAGDAVTLIRTTQTAAAMVTNRDPEDGNRSITIADLALDCRSQADDGIRTVRVEQLLLQNLSVTGCNSNGIKVSGHGRITRGAVLSGVSLVENRGDGLVVQWAMRNVRYTNIQALRNAGRGVVFDHSEAMISNVAATDNAGIGIYFRNVFATTSSNLIAIGNGRHGIFSEGLVASSGNNWIAQSNGCSPQGEFDEIHFSAADALSYGMTRRSTVNGIVVGGYADGTGRDCARQTVFVAEGIVDLALPNIVDLRAGGGTTEQAGPADDT